MDLGWKHLMDGDKDAILRGIADGVAYGGPYHVEIHPADRCNIDCFFCSTASLRGTDERNAKSRLTRLAAFVTRGDFSLREKLAHRRRFAGQIELQKRLEGLEEHCIIAWHSLVIRTSGMVAPCCILQGSDLGNIYQQPLDEIWNGEHYQNLRRELTRIMKLGPDWEPDPASDRIVVPMCGLKGGDDEICPIRSFYFRTDVPFMKGLNARLDELRRENRAGISAAARPHL